MNSFDLADEEKAPKTGGGRVNIGKGGQNEDIQAKSKKEITHKFIPGKGLVPVKREDPLGIR